MQLNRGFVILVFVLVGFANLHSFYWSLTRWSQADILESRLISVESTYSTLQEQLARRESATGEQQQVCDTPFFPLREYQSLVREHRALIAEELDLIFRSSQLFAEISQLMQLPASQQITALELPSHSPLSPPSLSPPPPPPPPSSSSLSKKLDAELPTFLYRPQFIASNSERKLSLPDYPPMPDPRSFYFDLPSELVNEVIEATDRGVSNWKEQLHEWTSNFVQMRLYQLQNPPVDECGSRPSISVEVDKACGFGCQIHHVNHCFKKAIHDGRMLIFSGDRWRHSTEGSLPCKASPANPSNGWNCAFQPLSPCMLGRTEANIFCPITESARYGLEYFVPPQIKRLVATFHRDPPVWFAGQTEAFLLRLATPVYEEIQEKMATSMAIPQRPMASIHIRRTDKIGTEAQFHNFEEYMGKLNELFAANLGAVPQQYTLHIMSDEGNIRKEIDNYFAEQAIKPHIILDDASAVSGKPSTRSSFVALKYLLADLYLAQKADFFVGTFSSQISRVIYELMQIPNVDPFPLVASLDDGWYYG